MGRTVKDQSSQTVPNQGIRIKDLMRRASMGQPIPNIGKNGSFDDPEDVEQGVINPVNQKGFDFVQAKNMLDNLALRQEEYLKKVESLKSAKRIKDEQERFTKAVQEEVQKQLKQAPTQ